MISKTFIVNSEDLFDKTKNPNLSLSAKDIEANPKLTDLKYNFYSAGL